jgi:hypothetical protein
VLQYLYVGAFRSLVARQRVSCKKRNAKIKRRQTKRQCGETGVESSVDLSRLTSPPFITPTTVRPSRVFRPSLLLSSRKAYFVFFFFVTYSSTMCISTHVNR